VSRQVLALASDEAGQASDAQSPDTDQILADHGTPLHAAAQRMFLLSDPGGKAQIRTILCVSRAFVRYCQTKPLADCLLTWIVRSPFSLA
jgi:hypothetical protein